MIQTILRYQGTWVYIITIIVSGVIAYIWSEENKHK